MRKIIYSVLIFLFSTFCVKGQKEGKMVNTGAANFLLITPDARGAGIGGAGVARTENDNAIFYNGATVLADNNHKGGATYSFIPWMRNYKSGYSLHTIGGFYKMDSRNAFLAGFRYYNYPKFTVMQGVEKTGEKIQPRELAVDIGYAREILSNLALSATLRYIYSDMGNVGEAGASGAIAFDIGAFYKNDIVGIQEGNWGLGIHISNISSKIKYLDRKENLPAMAKLGGMVNLPFSLIHRLLINVDLGYRMMPSDIQSLSVNTGIEYLLIERVMFRGGYHYGNKKKGDSNYATASLGVNYYGAHLDFAWLFAEKESTLRNSFWISLGFSF